jgi:hypothetical protein
MPITSLHEDHQSQKIYELKSTALVSTEAEQQAFRKAFIAYETLKRSLAAEGTIQDDFINIKPLNVLKGQITKSTLEEAQKAKALATIDDYAQAETQLYDALATALTENGLSTPLLDHNKQLPPTEHISGTMIVAKIIDTIQTRTLGSMYDAAQAAAVNLR